MGGSSSLLGKTGACKNYSRISSSFAAKGAAIAFFAGSLWESAYAADADPQQEIANLTEQRDRLLRSFQSRRVTEPMVPHEPVVPQDILNEQLLRAINECPPKFHELSFLKAEKKLRLKIYGNFINDAVNFNANNVDVNEEEICNHFSDQEIDDHQICNFLLHKVSSLPLGENLLYELPNFFEHNPNLLACLFREPRIFSTYPQGEDYTNDNLKIPLHLCNGKWIMERKKIKIRVANRIVGTKRICHFEYDPSAGGEGNDWLVEIFRLNKIFPLLNFDAANLKIGWAVVRLRENEEDIAQNDINIDDLVQDMGQQD